MSNKFFYLFLAWFLLFVAGAKAQEVSPAGRYTLQGTLLDAETSEGIPFSHISNLSSRVRVSSDSNGRFSIPVTGGDSIFITSVTYGQQIFTAPDEPANGERWIVRISPNVYELEEVVINRMPSEYMLKQQLLGLELPEEKGPNLRIPEGYFPQADPSANAAVGLGSPVSAIAGRFSKKERGRAFAAEVREKEARKEVIRTKFNREIVREITRLEDEDKLDAFMEYCVLSDDFLFAASEYEIHKAVLGCFSEFMTEQG